MLHRFDVSAYYRMAEIGLLRPDMRVELLDGTVTDLCRQTLLHAAVTHEVAKPFLDQPEKRCIVSIHNPVHLDDFNEPEPDMALLRFIPNYYRNRHPGPDDIFLLVEVADVSLEYDREKLPFYGRAGVMEAWIVNLKEFTVEVYRKPNFAGYGSKTVLHPGDQAKSLAFPDIALDVAELMKQ